jgi:hypothetical protein
MASKPKAKTNKREKRKAVMAKQQQRDSAHAEGRRLSRNENKARRKKFQQQVREAKATGKQFPNAAKTKRNAKAKQSIKDKEQARIDRRREAKTRAKGFCGAKKRNGEPCGRSAGWGTSHLGYGSCKHHAGSTLPGRVSSAGEAIKLTRPLPITPSQGLLGVLHLAAGQLAYVNERVAEIEETDMFLAREVDSVTGVAKMTPHYWIEFQLRIQDRVAKYSKLAADVGIAERAQSLREAQTMMMMNLIQAVMDDLGLDDEQRSQVGPSIRKHLTLLQGGTIEGEAIEVEDPEPNFADPKYRKKELKVS